MEDQRLSRLVREQTERLRALQDLTAVLEETLDPECDARGVLEAVQTNLRGALECAERIGKARLALASRPERQRILVVDDDAVHRIFAARALQKVGYEVAQAEDGAQALEYFRKGGHWDFILLDCQIPKLNGFEFSETVRALESGMGGHVIIAAYTSHSISGYRERCTQAGMDAFIQKPIPGSELAERVTELLKLECCDRDRQSWAIPEPVGLFG